MIGDRHPVKLRIKGTHGFTLIEVLVVMLIVGILATSVVFMFVNPNAKVKNQAFTMLGDLNMARSEAVTRNEDVLVDFIEGDVDGYQTCIDATPAGTPPGNNDCSDETGDNFIRETIFREEVQYYDPTSVPAGGPSTTPEAGSTADNLLGSRGILLDDGNLPNDPSPNFSMEPDGTLEDGITGNINVVIYVPTKNNHNEIYGTPYAVTISNSSGRVRISRWTGGAWNTK